MNRAEDEFTFASVVTIPNVDWNEKGFCAKGRNEELICWSEVVQVALVYEIHPIAILDWDYVAFRLKDTELSVWVEIKMEDPFVAEIERRFAPIAAPRMTEWKDEEMCIRSYSIWPKELRGEPLYVHRRKKWWSWSKSLALPKEPTLTTVASAARQMMRSQ